MSEGDIKNSKLFNIFGTLFRLSLDRPYRSARNTAGLSSDAMKKRFQFVLYFCFEIFCFHS